MFIEYFIGFGSADLKAVMRAHFPSHHIHLLNFTGSNGQMCRCAVMNHSETHLLLLKDGLENVFCSFTNTNDIRHL